MNGLSAMPMTPFEYRELKKFMDNMFRYDEEAQKLYHDDADPAHQFVLDAFLDSVNS